MSGYDHTIKIIEKSLQQSQLNEAKQLATYAEIALAQKNDNAVLKELKNFWEKSRKQTKDEYICIVNKDATLILHSKRPENVSKFAGDNLLTSHNKNALKSLADLAKKQNEYVGGYISSAGEDQIAAFAPVNNKQWLIGIHRSKSAIYAEVISQIRFYVFAYIIVCGMLLPISFFLMYITTKNLVGN